MSEIWEQKEDNKNAEWIDNMKKELPRLEEGTEADINLESPRATLKKVPNVETQGYDGIHGFWF